MALMEQQAIAESLATAADLTNPSKDWPGLQRIAFRLSFCYFGIYIFPFPFTNIPGTDSLGEGYVKMWHVILPWVGAHILHLSKPITVFENGSGDTTSNYVQLFCFLVFAIIGTVLWSLLDGKRKQYETLHDWLRTYVRYFLAFTMLGYGMAKVIKLQFISPGLGKLAEPFGDFSPMGLLWYFMGYSSPYTHFAGAMETIGGLLLFSRRTTTLGSLVISGVMLNVVLLNFFYDTPVKLFSSHLLLMAIFLTVAAVSQLLNLLVLNRPTVPANISFPWTPRWSARWIKIARVAVKAVAICYMLYANTFPNLAMAREYANEPRAPIYGIYGIDEITQDPGSEVARWRTMVFEAPPIVSIVSSDESMSRYKTEYNSAKNSLVIYGGPDGKQKSELTYSRPDSNHLVLRGNFLGHPVSLNMTRIDESKFLLPSRGFHWINEYPLNR